MGRDAGRRAPKECALPHLDLHHAAAWMIAHHAPCCKHESSKGSKRTLILLFDTVTAKTPILFCKQLSCACKTCRRSIRRNTDDHRYFLIRHLPGSAE